VQIEVAEVAADLSGQLLNRANALPILVLIAFPHGQRGTPVALATQRPVDVVLQPVSEPALADVFRHPVDGPVQLYEAVAIATRTHIP